MSSQNENKQSDLESFSYFISNNGCVVVATLSGLCESESHALLQQCKIDIESKICKSVHAVVLNFSGVTGIANDLIPFWAQLQSMIRSNGVELRLCGIESSLKEKLIKMGILRSTETSNTLKDAVFDIVLALKLKSQSTSKKVS